MNTHRQAFKDAAQLAAQQCGIRSGQLQRDLGLKDFLENAIGETDDAAAICVKAAAYFCEDRDPRLDSFRLAVLAMCSFLGAATGKKAGIQTMRDLVAILQGGGEEAQIRSWITSHFG